MSAAVTFPHIAPQPLCVTKMRRDLSVLVLLPSIASAFRLSSVHSPRWALAAGRLRRSYVHAEAPEAYGAELAKLQATLVGLREDGFPPDALEPLEAKIIAIEAKITAASALPPLDDDQRKIWMMSDDIDDAQSMAESGDDYAAQRLSTLRAERRFMMSGLFRQNPDAYVRLLEVLSTRAKTLPTADYPEASGFALTSVAAVEQAMAAANRVTADADNAARKAQELALAAEQQAAQVEAENEAQADASRTVDLVFARCFLTSEEALFGIPHKYVGKDMWSDAQDDARSQNFRDAFAVLVQRQDSEGSVLKEALLKISRVDPVAQRWAAEAADAEDTAAAALKQAPVELRLLEAWRDRTAFTAEWQARVPKNVEEDSLRFDGSSESAVGRMRRMGAATDSMSLRQRTDDEARDDWVDKANRWWNDNMTKK